MSSTDNVVPFNWRPEPEPEPVGFAQVSKAWLSRWSTDRRLTSGEQKICVRIYLHFNSDHFKETGDLLAWPSWQSLMDATGLSRPSVHRTLRGLKRLGAFETQRGPYDHENKKRGNTRYIVRTSKVSPVSTARKTPRPLSDTAARSMAAARPWGCRHDRLRAIAGIPISIPGHLSAL